MSRVTITGCSQDTVAELGPIGDALARRGYSADDVEAIMSRNWLRVLPKDAAGS